MNPFPSLWYTYSFPLNGSTDSFSMNSGTSAPSVSGYSPCFILQSLNDKPSLALALLARYPSLFDGYLANKASAKLGLSLRLCRMKHGEYPETLGALVPEFMEKLSVDPFSGKEYVYHKEGKGFIVYSL